MGKSLVKVFLCGILFMLIVGCGKKEEQQEEDKPAINLNDKIYYAIDTELEGRSCGGFAYPVDAEDIIAERWFSNTSGMKEVDKSELFSHSDINYDIEKEYISLEEWNLLTVPERGVKDFESGFIEHQFYYSYSFIKLLKDASGSNFKDSDDYYKIATEIDSDIFSFRTQIRTILVSRGAYHLKGTCPKGAVDVLLLDEKVCDEYNLDCGRW